MALRTTLQLQNDFPNGSTAQCAQSIRTLDQLVRDGFLGDNLGETKQIQDWIAQYTDTKGETFTPVVAVVGTTGSTARRYAVRPRYPLPMGSPGNSTALYTGQLAANYENEAAGKPPQGRGSPLAFLANNSPIRDNRTTLIGKPPTTFVDNASGPATLTTTNYLTVTTPALGLVPNTTFDIIRQIGATVFAIGVTGTVSVTDSIVFNFKTLGGVKAVGPFTVQGVASMTAAQAIAACLVVLEAQTAHGGLEGYEFAADSQNLIIVPANVGDTVSIDPTASTHFLVNGANTALTNQALALSPFQLIASNVAPSTTINDDGSLVALPYDTLGEYPHAEVWVDSSLNPTFTFSVPGTATVNDKIGLTFRTNSGTSSYSTTYTATASETAAQIATALQSLITAQIGNGLPLAGWSCTNPSSGVLAFAGPDPTADFVTIDLSNSENIAVDTNFKTVKFAITLSGTVTTSDGITATFQTQGGTLPVLVTIAGTASETAAAIATALVAAINLKTGIGQPLQGWTANVFSTADVLISAPEASDTVNVDPSASTHILVNASNSATGATAVPIALEKKQVGPLLLERFSGVNTYTAGGVSASQYGAGAGL